MAIMIGLYLEQRLSGSVTRNDDMPIPLYGFVEGDTVGLLVVADEGETVLELARKLQDAASIRVAHHERIDFVYDGNAIDPTLTVAEAGLQALDRFDVTWRHKL
jgi:Toluene-4-monooxygenase system protein B (TmoB)